MLRQHTYLKFESLTYPVYIGSGILNELKALIQPYLKSGGIYILTDLNTRDFCIPELYHHIPGLTGQPLFSIIPGEKSKELYTLEEIWIWLMNSGATRDSLLINLGGGVVSDLGGFAAATYKRGIPYINIPTSLIGQADAAIGGKTGVNISGVKNQAGLVYDPQAVFILPELLATLPEAHIKSGFAEIIKCAALSGNGFWEMVKAKKTPDQHDLFDLISETVKFKCNVVSEDPSDRSTRKILNFGHTVGHALESYNLENGGMLHGEAVAAGMICEAFLSFEIAGLPGDELEEISSVIRTFFDPKPIDKGYFHGLIRLMDHDKKKTSEGRGFSLLKSIGKPSFERSVDQVKIIKSFEYFNQIV
jgi:3-dehydroquinate synthase